MTIPGKGYDALKTAFLRSILVPIGSPTTGTKSQLLNRLQGDLTASRLCFHKEVDGRENARILSIDMGIKNLAFCVADVSITQSRTTSKLSGKRSPKPLLNISTWKRISVLKHDDIDAEANSQDDFAPPVLSQTAFSLVRDVFLPLRPTTVLIERQRFRSGGASAVQEWTLRVNMLEAMLWSVFTTLKSLDTATRSDPEALKDLQLLAVNPARVANFWLPQQKKVEKKDKINLVRAWLSGDGSDELDLKLDDSLMPIKDLLLHPGRGRKKLEASEGGTGKIDDLADCLLQASAVATWEANRRMFAAMNINELEKYCQQSRFLKP